MIVVVGLSHKTAPIEVRERVAVAKDALASLFSMLHKQRGVGESMVLSTCNRVEIYAAPKHPKTPDSEDAESYEELHDCVHAAVRVMKHLGGEAVVPHLLVQQGKAAVHHLFRVACSLDSLVLGEPQILGQLKDAMEQARKAKTLGPALSRATHRAVRAAKRVRTETALGAGQVSVSSVAVDLAAQIFGDLNGHTVLLIGAGEMAEAAAKLLVRAGAKLLLINRSPERAEALARELGMGEVRRWNEFDRALTDADIVISSTSSPVHVVTREMVKRLSRARKGRSLFFIDIAVPRDIEPKVNELDNVFLYDIDDLSQIVHASLEGRAAEAARAEHIVLEETKRFEAWMRKHALTPTIVGLRTRTLSVLNAELERSLSGKLKHLGPADREALRIMLEAATNKLLHTPTSKLRELAGDLSAAEYADALRELFDLGDVESPMQPGPAEEAAHGAALSDQVFQHASDAGNAH